MLIGVSSYPSVLVNELRIIIGQAVDPSSETQVVTSLLDQAQQQGVIETTGRRVWMPTLLPLWRYAHDG